MAQVSLTVPNSVPSDDLRRIVIEVKEYSGKPINDFKEAHKVSMPDVVISNNLQFFEFSPSFLEPGNYKLWGSV